MDWSSFSPISFARLLGSDGGSARGSTAAATQLAPAVPQVTRAIVTQHAGYITPRMLDGKMGAWHGRKCHE